jgi:hypothetical protein
LGTEVRGLDPGLRLDRVGAHPGFSWFKVWVLDLGGVEDLRRVTDEREGREKGEAGREKELGLPVAYMCNPSYSGFDASPRQVALQTLS